MAIGMARAMIMVMATVIVMTTTMVMVVVKAIAMVMDMTMVGVVAMATAMTMAMTIGTTISTTMAITMSSVILNFPSQCIVPIRLDVFFAVAKPSAEFDHNCPCAATCKQRWATAEVQAANLVISWAW